MAIAVAGCGAGSFPLHDLSGAVTYHGQPVTCGYLVFTPDAAKGNNGPGTSAEIENGRFKTRPGEGTIGGPHIVSINGFDGQPYQDGQLTIPNGKPLFIDLKVAVELPMNSTTHDFHLPNP